MTQAKNGDVVRVHYRGTLQDGLEFDSSAGQDPIEFQIGAGQVIPGFENGIKGLSIGESKTIHIPADQAYGARSEEHIHSVPRNSFPEGLDVSVGSNLTATSQDGQQIPLTVIAQDDETVTLDGNHPLAGQDLTFELQLVEIVS